MARRGLDRAQVVAAAGALADREGLEAVTLGRLAAELRVRPPSLYNHVEGLDGVLRGIALQALEELTAELQAAAVGRSGPDALRATARALRAFALRRPGAYAAIQRGAPDDPQIGPASARPVEVIAAVLHAWGLEGDDAIHAVRIVRSALHGFVALELSGGFGLPLDLDETFDRLVDVLAKGL